MTKTTIRKNDYGEFVVRLWDGSTQIGDGYFTSDKQDAVDTAKDMLERYRVGLQTITSI